MHHSASIWRALMLGLLLTLAVLALSACGGGGQGSSQGGRDQDSAKSEIENPLVGTWRRERTCDEYVRSMKQAGLEELIPEWVAGAQFGGASVSPAQVRQQSDPCQGLRNVNDQHDHVFYKDGRFASLNENGEFVDEGHYKLADERTLVFPEHWGKKGPSITAHFRFSNDNDAVTFDLVLPDNLDKCSQLCREAYAWGVAVTYPGHPWKRVPPGEQWPGEV